MQSRINTMGPFPGPLYLKTGKDKYRKITTVTWKPPRGPSARLTACVYPQCVLGHVDFSGRSGASRWVMGMAQACATKPDPLLMWPVPESWSMEDATTIPLAYATVCS